MTPNELKSHLGPQWDSVQELISGALGSDVRSLDAINAGLISNAGKQLRPLLLLLVARALGTPGNETCSYAAASELLHNATLLHDDVADCSETRRGNPTVNAVHGPTASVLIGDFWLSRALSVIIGTPHHDIVLPLFAKTLSDLAEGELLQQEKAESADTTEEDYLRIIYCKTASLFETCCRAGAVSVGAPKELEDAAGRLGAAIGTAFQMMDDIFDYTPSANIGKPVGADLEERKITLPLLGALQNVSPAGQARIRAMVAAIPTHPENCAAVSAFALENGGMQYARRRLSECVEEALAALEAFPASSEKELLAEYTRFLEVRTK